MKYPPKIQKGKKVAIISPATPISLSPERVQQAYNKIRFLGVDIYEASHCYIQSDEKVHPKKIAEEINSIFKDESIGAIVAFWGGSGTNAILEFLDFDMIRQNPKPVIGYSDTTALLHAVSQQCQQVTYLGAAAVTFSKPIKLEDSLNSFKDALLSNDSIEIVSPSFYTDDLFYPTFSDPGSIKNNEGYKIFRKGRAEGLIFAGTIATLSALVGTPYLYDPADKILFLELSEDHDFRRLVRWLYQFRQLGWFSGAKGVVFSKFTKASKVNEKDFLNLLNEVFDGVNIPVIYNADFGHTDPILTIPIGGTASLDVRDEDVALTVQY